MWCFRIVILLEDNVVLWMFVVGVCLDVIDEYCRISEIIVMESMKRFCVVVRLEFVLYYLW